LIVIDDNAADMQSIGKSNDLYQRCLMPVVAVRARMSLLASEFLTKTTGVRSFPTEGISQDWKRIFVLWK